MASEDNIRSLMATPPHPEFAGREPPTEEQLRAIEAHLLQRGFHPSVVHEQRMVAQLFGMDKALESMGQLEQQYPAYDGVPGTAARSSRQDYFDDLNANRYQPGDHALEGTKWDRPLPRYPERLTRLPQKGTPESYEDRRYKRGRRGRD